MLLNFGVLFVFWANPLENKKHLALVLFWLIYYSSLVFTMVPFDLISQYLSLFIVCMCVFRHAHAHFTYV